MYQGPVLKEFFLEGCLVENLVQSRTKHLATSKSNSHAWFLGLLGTNFNKKSLTGICSSNTRHKVALFPCFKWWFCFELKITFPVPWNFTHLKSKLNRRFFCFGKSDYHQSLVRKIRCSELIIILILTECSCRSFSSSCTEMKEFM